MSETTLPLIPPVCPNCRCACLYEATTPLRGSGILAERHYCPQCGWNPAVDVCTYCGEPIGGGPGGYFSAETLLEVCDKSPTTFHENDD